jgi:hypothetical protein
MVYLKLSVIISALFSLVALCFLIYQAMAFGQSVYYSKEKGSRMRGILYAFGRGMMPWEKESAGKHLPSYLAGVTYHIGIFAALIYLAFMISSFEITSSIMTIFQIIMLAGGLCGLGLLAKRIFSPVMKFISYPDDYASNSIVDLFIFLALFSSFSSAAASLLYIIAILMFLYIPLGKIRHCFFFFLTRMVFGIFFGRRKVFN